MLCSAYLILLILHCLYEYGCLNGMPVLLGLSNGSWGNWVGKDFFI